MDDTTRLALIGGLLTGLGGFVTALIGAIVLLLNSVYKNRQEGRAADAKVKQDRWTAAAAEQSAIIDRLERQLARYEEHSQKQQDLITRMQEMHSSCREEVAEVWGYIDRLRDYCGRMKHDADLGPPPRIPDRRKEPDDLGFPARTIQQDALMLKANSEKLLNPDAGKP